MKMTQHDAASSSAAILPDPTLPAPPLNDEEEGFTAEQLIQRQAKLEQAARQAVPFSYAKDGCTYERGYIRQPVYACRTCGGGGVCAGCSVGCHADHDLIELFAKRAFRCDCGTLSLCRDDPHHEKTLAPCSLRVKNLTFAPQNDANKYGQNFDGAFCRCERGKTYDAEKEEETMFQCLCCEDWIHESCCSIRPSSSPDDNVNTIGRTLADGPILDHDTFDLFICDTCVRKPENRVLRNYLGSQGWIVCLPERPSTFLPDEVDNIPSVRVMAKGADWQYPWRVYGLLGGTASADASFTTIIANASFKTITDAQAQNEKRNLDESEQDVQDTFANEPKKKKQREGLTIEDSFSDAGDETQGGDEPLIPASAKETGEDVCTEPDIPLFVQENKSRLDVFLTEDFRSRICRCSTCAVSWAHLPFVMTAEETYSPARSQASSNDGRREGGDDALDGQSDAGASQTSSMYDLGLAALSQLPREQMMGTLEAYNKMRDALFTHLRPFAEQGKVVDAESVREFFRRQREDSQRGARS